MKKPIILLTLFIISSSCLAWKESYSVNKMDDTKTKYVHVYADTNNRPPEILVWCENGNNRVVIDTKRYLGNRSSKVEVRFDNAKSQVFWMNISSTGKALMPKTDIDNDWFMGRLKDSKRVLIRAYNYRGIPSDVFTFNTEGADKVLKSGCPID